MLSSIAAIVSVTVDDSCGPREQLDNTNRRQRHLGCYSSFTATEANTAHHCRRLTTIRSDQVAGHRWNHRRRLNRRLHRRHRQPSNATGSGNTSFKNTGSRRRPSSRRPLDGGVEGSSMYARSTTTTAAVASTTATDRTDDRRRLWRNTNANTWIAADDDNWTAVPGDTHTVTYYTHHTNLKHTHTPIYTHIHIHIPNPPTYTQTHTHDTRPQRIPQTESLHDWQLYETYVIFLCDNNHSSSRLSPLVHSIRFLKCSRRRVFDTRFCRYYIIIYDRCDKYVFARDRDAKIVKI